MLNNTINGPVQTTETSILATPMVIKPSAGGERAYDIFSRILEDRIIMLFDQVTPESAQLVIAQLLYLASIDPNTDITIYINSPGGSVADGLAIYDTMNFIKPDVSTVCIGHAASMGAFLLSGGQKGKRFVLPNAEVMIHQPLGGMNGQATDMEIAMKHMSKTKETLTRYLAQHTNQPYEKVLADTDRDNWMSAEEAVAYGLADKIITQS